jgi:hypothetical protein
MNTRWAATGRQPALRRSQCSPDTIVGRPQLAAAVPLELQHQTIELADHRCEPIGHQMPLRLHAIESGSVIH